MQRRPRGLSVNYANEEERVRELLNDRSTLALALLSKDNWIRNDQRPHCYFCQRRFRPLVRTQHHCRGCGEVVCRACNRHRKVLVGSPQKQRTRIVRLCVDCIDKATIATNKASAADASFHALDGAAAAGDKDQPPGCSFLFDSLRGSNADTTRASASAHSYLSSISASLASLERSASESSASDASFEWMTSSDRSSRISSRDSNREGEFRGDRSRINSHRSSRSTRRHQERRQQPIEFLPETEQLKIYEVRRQELLALYGIVDSEPQTEYDALCELASRALECPVAAVGFLDGTRQWYKARLGISQSELPRNIAFCSQVLQSALPTIIMDASQDPRFCTNPLVTSSVGIRFYATAPICDPATGVVIGSVFVMDRVPKTELPPRAMEILAYLSIAAEKLLLSGSSLHAQARRQRQHQRAEVIHKRKHRVYSAPTIASACETEETGTRPASLQCVPEELETKDDFGGLSHAIPRSARERVLYELIDPSVLLPQSLSRRSSESELVSSRAPAAFASPSRAQTIAAPPPPRAQRRMSASSMEWSEHADSEGTVGDARQDLLRRISSTQQQLARQRAFLAMLSASPSSIQAIGETMGHIENAMRELSVAGSRLGNSSDANELRTGERVLEREPPAPAAATDADAAAVEDEENPFSQYYGMLLHQQNMLQDRVRTSAYERAVLENAAGDFRDKVVLDVGTGSGILAFFALRAGARRVYAVELSAMAECARALLAHNGLADRVEVIRGKMEDVVLPERVDVVLSEPMGFFLVHERMLETFVAAGKKWRRAPDPAGAFKMYPSRGTMFAAPFSDDAIFREQLAKAAFWDQRDFYGLDLSVLRARAVENHFSQPVVGYFPADMLLATQPATHVLDFKDVAVEALHTFDMPFRFEITKTAIMHGLGCWFTVDFLGSNAHVTLSTAPDEPGTHWYQCRLLLPTPIAVNASQTVSGNLHFVANKKFSYDIEMEVHLDGTSIAARNLVRLHDQMYHYLYAGGGS
ncbi:hypothetical protein PybrP1_007207 [[Pythium] brassicae (nom. inval.)]|nr:hypothetical protein PybrP1_007207 [[Pythium] brassicae (nom. inval.)]